MFFASEVLILNHVPTYTEDEKAELLPVGASDRWPFIRVTHISTLFVLHLPSHERNDKTKQKHQQEGCGRRGGTRTDSAFLVAKQRKRARRRRARLEGPRNFSACLRKVTHLQPIASKVFALFSCFVMCAPLCCRSQLLPAGGACSASSTAKIGDVGESGACFTLGTDLSPLRRRFLR